MNISFLKYLSFNLVVISVFHKYCWNYSKIFVFNNSSFFEQFQIHFLKMAFQIIFLNFNNKINYFNLKVSKNLIKFITINYFNNQVDFIRFIFQCLINYLIESGLNSFIQNLKWSCALIIKTFYLCHLLKQKHLNETIVLKINLFKVITFHFKCFNIIWINYHLRCLRNVGAKILEREYNYCFSRNLIFFEDIKFDHFLNFNLI